MTVFIFGEAMLEYHSHGGADGLRYGGDTLNTAIHLARMGQDVAYVTAVGTDPISDALVAAWAAEGVNTQYILRHPSRSPGIYAIHVDDRGERSFLYWRNQSAARDMFALPSMGEVLEAAAQAEMLYFSLISLAILPDDGCTRLLDLAAKLRDDGQMVAYDSNFRLNLWANLEQAQAMSTRAMDTATIGLPTNVDEQQLRGHDISEANIAASWLTSGCQEVVVKAGEVGCLFASPDTDLKVYAANRVQAVDSSGAGDAFNAGYLAARLNNKNAADAIADGQQLARWVVSNKGAIPPANESAPY